MPWQRGSWFLAHSWGRAVIRDPKISSSGGSGWEMHARSQRWFPCLPKAVRVIFYLFHPWEWSRLTFCCRRLHSPSLLTKEPYAHPLPRPCKLPLAPYPRPQFPPSSFSPTQQPSSFPTAQFPFISRFSSLTHGLPLIFKCSYSSPSFSGGNFNKCTNICYS